MMTTMTTKMMMILMVVMTMVMVMGVRDARAQSAEELLAAMTPEEKFSMVKGINGFLLFQLQDGWYIGNINAIPRLGIPPLKMHDGPQGFRPIFSEQIDQVTQWPCALAVAATFDTDAVAGWGDRIAAEFLAKGANMLLGPAMDLGRLARGGRNAESLAGEDPAIGVHLVPAYVRAVQARGVLATMKHYDAYTQETNRMVMNAVVDNRTLWEMNHPPFAAAVAAGVASCMCAYNRVNGRYACQQPELLNDDLKRDMAFQGFVVSDWWATRSTQAALAGLDQDQPGAFPFFNEEQLTSLPVPQERIDDMVLRILRPMVEYGLVNASAPASCVPPEGCYEELYVAQASTEEHRQFARQLATESAILLQNNGGTLPLALNPSPAPFRLAVIGSACTVADSVETGGGTGSYFNIGGSGAVISTRSTNILTALRATLDANNNTDITLLVDDTDNVDAALALIATADATLICAGATTTEFSDRSTLDADQEPFLAAVAAGAPANASLIVLLMAPGSINTNAWRGSVDAIVVCFLCGEAAGFAFVDVVFGTHNPSGKLPITFVAADTTGSQPCTNPAQSHCYFDDGLLVGYRGFSSADVSFPFGHGLSYTSFSYTFDASSCDGDGDGDDNDNDNDNAAAAAAAAAAAVCWRVRVTNTGDRTGSETVQLYVVYPISANEPAVPVLKTFAKARNIPAGESVVVSLSLTPRDLSFWSPDVHGWVPASGEFVVYIAASYTDIRLVTTFFNS